MDLKVKGKLFWIKLNLFYLLFLKLFLFQKEARIGPEILCQILKKAPARAESDPKYLIANAVARPEFCIPTSIAKVLAIFSE